MLWVPGSGQIYVGGQKGGDRLEGTILSPHVPEIRRRERGLRPFHASPPFPQLNQMLRRAERQWRQKNRVENAEDQGSRADSERERADGQRRCALCPDHAAKRVFQILQERIGKAADPRIPHAFLYLLDAANFEKRRAPGRARFHTAAHLFFRQQIRIGQKLVREFLLNLSPAEKSAPKSGKGKHSRLLRTLPRAPQQSRA